jgi:hypothetical protein
MDQLNKLLNNERVKIFLILTTSILSGYVLQPVPPFLHNLFQNSHTFKFFILFTIGMVIFHPLNNEKFIMIIFSCILILFIIDRIRKI